MVDPWCFAIHSGFAGCCASGLTVTRFGELAIARVYSVARNSEIRAAIARIPICVRRCTRATKGEIRPLVLLLKSCSPFTLSFIL